MQEEASGDAKVLHRKDWIDFDDAKSDYVSDEFTKYSIPRQIKERFDADFGIICIGQSLALGSALFDVDSSVYSLSPRNSGEVLMPSTGVFCNGEDFSGYVDAHATPHHHKGARTTGEMPLFEAGSTICANFHQSYGHCPTFVILCSARGGYGLMRLWPGSAVYDEIIKSVELCIKVSKANGRIFEVSIIDFPWGESFTNALYYPLMRDLKLFRQTLVRDIKLLTGQIGSPPIVVHAPMRGAPTGPVQLCAAQRCFFDLSEQAPCDWILCGPAYGVDHGVMKQGRDGDGHPTILGYRQLGALRGRAWFQAMTMSGFCGMRIREISRVDARRAIAKVDVPLEGELRARTDDTIIGFPGDASHPAYLGSADATSGATSGEMRTGATAHAGGLWARSAIDDSQIGIESWAIGPRMADGLFPLTFTTHRETVPGEVLFMPAARPTAMIEAQGFYGTRLTGPRTIFESSIRLTIPDSDEDIRDRLLPSLHRY